MLYLLIRLAIEYLEMLLLQRSTTLLPLHSWVPNMDVYEYLNET